ncbi:MAG: hypothetical protein OXG16_14090 [Rhodospirillales bacterium]|nr:hypothetical protein [Rhodospirillales bacterium]
MNNPWTPERVKKLTELWLAGWTRAQVAEALGPPVTESAVKGKVRRLGLKRDGGTAGKRHTGAQTPRRASPARSAQSAAGSDSAAHGSAVPAAGAGSSELSRHSFQDTADELAWSPEDASGEGSTGDALETGEPLSEDQPTFVSDRRPDPASDAMAPGAGAADSASERTGEREFRFPGYNECHWPHGEPDNPDFDFCLAPAAPGKSYCEEHAEQAYRKKGS